MRRNCSTEWAGDRRRHGAVVALIDRDDAHHKSLLALFKEDPYQWLLPWAILPEVDYLLSSYVGLHAEQTFVSDVATGAFRTDWGVDDEICSVLSSSA